MAAALERRSVTVEGVALSYVERETGAGSEEAPILLLHGLIATGETFGGLIAELPRTRRLLALDLPGAGFSERSLTADVSFAGMAGHVQGFMEAVGLRKPVLLGHSHGGAVSLRLAATHPELLRALVLLAPAHPWSGHERAIINFYLTTFGRGFAKLLPSVPAWLHWQAFKAMSGPKGKRDRSVLELYRASGKVPGTVDHTLRLLSTWHTDMAGLCTDLEAHPIALPALLMWGDHDRIVPETTAAALEVRLPQSRHITLPGIGHLPNEEAASLCGEHICRWLETLSS